MHKDLISKLNRGIKRYEKDLEIIIIENGSPLETEFYRVCDFNGDVILFALRSAPGKLVNLSYSYSTGKLQYEKDCSDVVIGSLFSNRHLRSILFYAWDFRYCQENELDEYNTLMHKKYPVPVLRTSTSGDGNEKKDFKIDGVTITGNTIKLSGILSVKDRDYFDQPIIASCIHNLKNDTYKWSYQVAGIMVSRVCSECVESTYVTDPSCGNLLRIHAELANNHYLQSENGYDQYEELTKCILRKLKNFEFHICSTKANRMGLYEMLRFIIKRIEEINDSEIVFEVCDLNIPSMTLVYDRTFGGVYLKKKNTYSMNKPDYEVAHNQDGNTDKFLGVIKLVEKFHLQSCQK